MTPSSSRYRSSLRTTAAEIFSIAAIEHCRVAKLGFDSKCFPFSFRIKSSKPLKSNDYQNVLAFQLDRIKLKNGDVLDFKDVKKTNEPISGKEVFKQSELVLKKRNKFLRFNSGERLIILNGMEGTFKGIDSEYLIINTGNSFDKKIPISLIKSISVPSKTSSNIGFKKGACLGAGVYMIPLTIISVDNKDPFEFMVGTIIVAPVMAVLGGLTSYILPKGRKSKVYLIQENEWEIVNY